MNPGPRSIPGRAAERNGNPRRLPLPGQRHAAPSGAERSTGLLRRTTERRLASRRAIVFAGSCGLALWLALHGGAYDIVDRQEVFLAIWIFLGIGFATSLLPRSRPPWVSAIPLCAVAALAALTLLSLTWTSSQERTFNEFARLVGYGGFLALAFACVNRYTWRAAAAGLSVAAIAVCGVALASRLFPDAFSPDPVLLAFKHSRLDYPFYYWNAVAAWGAMAVTIALAWSAHARSTLTRTLALASVPMCAVTVYVTYSRGGIIATAIGVIAVVALSRNRWTVVLHAMAAALATAALILVVRGEPQIADGVGSDGGAIVLIALLIASAGCAAVPLVLRAAGADALRLPKRAALASCLGLLAIVVAVAVTAGREPISQAWDDFKSERRVESSSADPASRVTTAGGERYGMWSSALDAFKSDELRGIGPGTFEFWWAQNRKSEEFVRDAHSLYFEQLAELGLPGFLLVVCFLGSLLVLAIGPRLRGRTGGGAAVAMVAAFGVFLVVAGIDWMWEYPAITGLALLGIGVCAAERSGRRRPMPWTARACLFAIALAAALVQVPGIVGTERMRAASAALNAGDAPVAIELAGQAIDAEPWAASPYAQRGLAEFQAGQLSRARADLNTAHEKEPRNYRYLLALSELRLAGGDIRGAVKAGRRAGDLAYSSRFLPEVESYVGGLILRIDAAKAERQ